MLTDGQGRNVEPVIPTPTSEQKRPEALFRKRASGRYESWYLLFNIYGYYLRRPAPTAPAKLPPPPPTRAPLNPPPRTALKLLELKFPLLKLPVLELITPELRIRIVFGLEKVLSERIVFGFEKVCPARIVFEDPERNLVELKGVTLRDETLERLRTKFLCVPVPTLVLKLGFRFHTLWSRRPPLCHHHGWCLNQTFAL